MIDEQEAIATRERFNARSKAWFDQTSAELRNHAGQLGLKLSGTLIRSIIGRMYKRAGLTIGGGITMPRYGVWVHKGARRGHGGRKGSRWWSSRVRTTQTRGALKGVSTRGGWVSTNPASLGKMNTGRSRAVAWFDPVVEKQMPKLAAIAAEYWGDTAIQQIRIK